LKHKERGILILAVDATLEQHGNHWFVREVTKKWHAASTLARLDVSSRSYLLWSNQAPASLELYSN